ncbi:MAG: hypothetical protein GX176_01580 [Syntrophomonadaceae bacterium]|jgi:hypothetical protein|nr:hypothetical protein [Bacillota bacterium]NLM87453.1 hypothetical protein [Syntrophomonadaceae bacterium]
MFVIIGHGLCGLLDLHFTAKFDFFLNDEKGSIASRCTAAVSLLIILEGISTPSIKTAFFTG